MKLQLFAVLAMVVSAFAQGVTDRIAPTGDSPAGCLASSDGEFEIAVVPLSIGAKRGMALEV